MAVSHSPCLHIRSATLNFALRLLGFLDVSSTDGLITRLFTSRTLGLWPHAQTGACGGHMHDDASRASSRFTNLSSNEW